MTAPLEGVRVLDFTRVLAGPFASRMLSDLGADVVKVEPPEGDVTRLMGRRLHGIGGYFHQQNAGKRSICLDMARPGATELVLQMAGKADIVLENFRPGIMDRHGLGWETLRSRNAQLVMLSISGFGQHGPERDRASYAAVVHAETGLLARQATVDRDQPTDITLSVADSFTALHGLVAVLAAYHYASMTGIGQHIDLSMVDATVVTDDYAHLALEGAQVTNAGGQVFAAVGGPLVLAGDEKWWWHQLSRIGGLIDPTPEGADLPTKIACRRQAIEQYMLSFPNRAALLAALDKANLAWGDVRDHRRAYEDQATIRHRATITSVDDRHGGTRRLPQSPYRFSAADAAVRGPAPYRGEHNREVLHDWLTLTDDEIDHYRQQEILLAEPLPD